MTKENITFHIQKNNELAAKGLISQAEAERRNAELQQSYKNTYSKEYQEN